MISFKLPLQIYHIVYFLLLLIRILIFLPINPPVHCCCPHPGVPYIRNLYLHPCISLCASTAPALPCPTLSKAPCISLPEAADRPQTLVVISGCVSGSQVLPWSIQEVLDMWIGTLVTYKKAMAKARDALKQY